MHDRFVGVTSLDKAGEGLEIKFSLADLRKLQLDNGKSFFNDVEVGMASMDMEMAETLLAVGGRKNNERLSLTFDDLGEAYSLADICTVLLDAFMISLHGKTHAEWIAWVEAEIAKRKAKGEDPSPEGSEILSTNIVEPPSEPA